jgi:hypothetical protein
MLSTRSSQASVAASYGYKDPPGDHAFGSSPGQCAASFAARAGAASGFLQMGECLAAVVPDDGDGLLLNDRILCINFGAVAVVVREQNVAKISTFYAAQPVPPSWSVETALA